MRTSTAKDRGMPRLRRTRTTPDNATRKLLRDLVVAAATASASTRASLAATRSHQQRRNVVVRTYQGTRRTGLTLAAGYGLHALWVNRKQVQDKLTQWGAQAQATTRKYRADHTGSGDGRLPRLHRREPEQAGQPG